jgi:hypothetical protein
METVWAIGKLPEGKGGAKIKQTAILKLKKNGSNSDSNSDSENSLKHLYCGHLLLSF